MHPQHQIMNLQDRMQTTPNFAAHLNPGAAPLTLEHQASAITDNDVVGHAGGRAGGRSTQSTGDPHPSPDQNTSCSPSSHDSHSPAVMWHIDVQRPVVG